MEDYTGQVKALIKKVRDVITDTSVDAPRNRAAAEAIQDEIQMQLDCWNEEGVEAADAF